MAILEKSADPLFIEFFLAVTITYQRRAFDCVVGKFSAEHRYNIAEQRCKQNKPHVNQCPVDRRFGQIDDGHNNKYDKASNFKRLLWLPVLY